MEEWIVLDRLEAAGRLVPGPYTLVGVEGRPARVGDSLPALGKSEMDRPRRVEDRLVLGWCGWSC